MTAPLVGRAISLTPEIVTMVLDGQVGCSA